jgi:hypothetical protein
MLLQFAVSFGFHPSGELTTPAPLILMIIRCLLGKIPKFKFE